MRINDVGCCCCCFHDLHDAHLTAMAVHYDKCSSVMMKLLATLRRVYEHLGKCFEPGWLGHLFPPTSTIITARFAQLDTELVATLQELSDVLPSLRSAAQSLSMYRRYTNGTSGWWLFLLMLQTALTPTCLRGEPTCRRCKSRSITAVPR